MSSGPHGPIFSDCSVFNDVYPTCFRLAVEFSMESHLPIVDQLHTVSTNIIEERSKD